MPKRTLRRQSPHPAKVTAGFSSSLSDISVPMEYGQLEEPIQPTRVTPHEFRLPPAALSAARSPHFTCITDNLDRITPSTPEKFGLGIKLESFLLRATNCCVASLASISRPYGPSVADNAPLLSSVSHSSDVPHSAYNMASNNNNRQQQSQFASAERSINVEVVNWMQRRLSYFFMTPLEKYKAKQRIPYKLFVQILKVLFITLQLIEFAYSRSSHVSFGENTRLAMSHLYLREWGTEYETLDYPPAAGPYAIYEKNDFYENIGYVLTRFNRTHELALGAYLMDRDNPPVSLCLTNTSIILATQQSKVLHTEHTYCVDVYPAEIAPEKLSTGELVESFLQSQGLLFEFSRVLYFQIRFVLLSPVVTHLDWSEDPECFRFDVLIHMERLKQSGLMAIRLLAPYAGAHCVNLERPNSTDLLGATAWVQPLRQFWFPSKQNGTSLAAISTRRILVITLDAVVAVLGTVSFVLCVRSLVRGFLMWRDTTLFFDNWFSIRLCGVIGEFVQPWLLVIIINDLMIVFGSVYTLSHLYGLERRSEPTAYVFGISALLVWSGVLRYVGFSYRNSLLMRTIAGSIPALLRFCVCALILFFAFSLCGWVVLGPYNLKFRSFMSTMECLFSLLNGDDMFVTFSVINTKDPMGIYLFSRLFLYVFITLFIYVVLNLFVTIIFEAYEQVKELQDNDGRSPDKPLWTFVMSNRLPPDSPQYKMDDHRPDRHMLRAYALGILSDPLNGDVLPGISTNRAESDWLRNTTNQTPCPSASILTQQNYSDSLREEQSSCPLITVTSTADALSQTNSK